MHTVTRHGHGSVVVTEIHPDTQADHALLQRAYPHIGAFAFVCTARTQPLPAVSYVRDRRRD